MAAMNDLPPTPESGTGPAAEVDGAMRTELSADRISARQARPAIRQALAAWQMEHLSGNAELRASELVANAAEPGGRPGITCEVTDSSPTMPRHREPGADAERGRSLAIVAALARSTGVRASHDSKTGWFALALTDRAHRAARQIDHEPEAGA
jgi:hypothetical protein